VLVARDGRRVVCRGRATPQMAPARHGVTPRCVGARAFYRDVTAERQSEAVCARLVATLHASPDFVAVTTRDGEFVYLNRAGRHLVGLAQDGPLDALRGRDVRPAAEAARFEATILPAALRDGRWVGESALLGPDGDAIPVVLTVVAHPSARAGDHTPYFLSTIARDLRAERTASETLARLSEVASGIDDSVIIADAAGRVTWVNAAFTRLTGYAADEVLGRTPGSVLQGPGTDAATAARLRDAVRAGHSARAEVLNYRKDGSCYWLDLTISPVRWPRRRASSVRRRAARRVGAPPRGAGAAGARDGGGHVARRRGAHRGPTAPSPI
jgi:PAS domain S-box-containing protein